MSTHKEAIHFGLLLCGLSFPKPLHIHACIDTTPAKHSYYIPFWTLGGHEVFLFMPRVGFYSRALAFLTDNGIVYQAPRTCLTAGCDSETIDPSGRGQLQAGLPQLYRESGAQNERYVVLAPSLDSGAGLQIHQ